VTNNNAAFFVFNASPSFGVQIAEMCFGSKAEQFSIASKNRHCLLMRMNAQPQVPHFTINHWVFSILNDQGWTSLTSCNFHHMGLELNHFQDVLVCF